MSRVVFHDPFLDMLGGGEKYLLSILELVAEDDRADVVLVCPRPPDVVRWRRLGIDIEAERLHWRPGNQLAATWASRSADLFVTLTNHVPPLSLARRSVTVVQYPFTSLHGGGSMGRGRRFDRGLRLRSYDTVLCYSDFVAAAIRNRLDIADPVVIPPPVAPPERTPPGPRRLRVLAVGRFFPAQDANNKKHELMIDTWKRLEGEPSMQGWELHLAGGVHENRASQAHLERLRDRARGSAITFHPNAAPDELARLYDTSELFWHAAGYGEVDPERHEHFGITTVEAMAHGCVPVVVALGGQREIVEDGVSGRLWETQDALVSVTADLVRRPDERARLSEGARAAARRFEPAAFERRVRDTVLTPVGVGVA